MKSFFKILNFFKKKYGSLSNWAKIFLFVIVLLVILSFFKTSTSNSQEGFIQKESFVQKTGSDVYDDFYADIYDYLVYSDLKNEYELGEIINKTTPTSESIILDIGSGTGHHVGALSKDNLNVIGIDKSEAMVKKAKDNYPSANFKTGDAYDSKLFAPNYFTHIISMYFTIYYFKNKHEFFENCFRWLKPGGFLVIHLVNKDMFDPILPPGNPLLFVSPQKYAKKRITRTKVAFTDFAYESEFKLDENNKNICYFVEKFKNKNNNQTRKNEHILYMDSQESILTTAQETGFILEAQADLIKSQYEYQYLYFLIKPS